MSANTDFEVHFMPYYPTSIGHHQAIQNMAAIWRCCDCRESTRKSM